MKIKILSFMVSLLALFACDTETPEDSPTPLVGDVYIRFVSPTGTNVLDSLAILDEDLLFSEINPDTLSITVSRESDGVTLTRDAITDKRWVRVGENKFETFFHEEETLVKFTWSDMKTMLTENRPHEYEEVYKIQLNSPVIFADDDVHTIDWFVKVSGRGFQDAYKCEVDREEIPLGDDPYYKKKTTKDRHSVAAVVTFICQ